MALTNEEMSNFYNLVQRIGDARVTEDRKTFMIKEISDDLDSIITSCNYQDFLVKFLKALFKVLSTGTPKFLKDNSTNQLRKGALQAIYRLLFNDAVKGQLHDILDLSIKFLEVENEMNVILCVRIIIEIVKKFKPRYCDSLSQFLKFTRKVFADIPNNLTQMFVPKEKISCRGLTELNMESILANTFIPFSFNFTTGNDARGNPIVVENQILPLGSKSLKVMQELPIVVVLFYQLYKENIKRDLVEFVPLILQTLSLNPSAELRESNALNKECFVEFVAVQAKSLSFLAYIGKLFQDSNISSNPELLVNGAINVLTICPKEQNVVRKDLIVALRHILSSNLRNAFVPRVEALCDEKILLGKGWTTWETMRPLAYSTLADFLHHVRNNLPLAAIMKALTNYSFNLHDEALAISVQTMSAKLLLNLLDCMQQRSETDSVIASQLPNSQLVSKLMKVIILKYKTVATLYLPSLLNLAKNTVQQLQDQCVQKNQESNSTTQQALTTMEIPEKLVELKKHLDNGCSVIGGTSVQGLERQRFGFPHTQSQVFSANDCKNLVRSLTFAFKTATLSTAKINPGTEERKCVFLSPREISLFIRALKWAIRAFDVYAITPSYVQNFQPASSPRSISKEETEVLMQFNETYFLLHPQSFREVLKSTISDIVKRIFLNPSLQIINDKILENEEMGPIYSVILMKYLFTKLPKLDTMDMDHYTLYVRLYKSVFDNSNSFYEIKEHSEFFKCIKILIQTCMELAMKSNLPTSYLSLILILFHSASNRENFVIHYDFIPNSCTLIKWIANLQSLPCNKMMHQIITELCVTVPHDEVIDVAYLPILLNPIMSALMNPSHDIVAQALNSLEQFIDNSESNILHALTNSKKSDLMHQLYRLMNHKEENVANKTFRLLGKFGGEARRGLTEPQEFPSQPYVNGKVRLSINFNDENEAIYFDMTQIIEASVNIISDKSSDVSIRKVCLNLLGGFFSFSFNEETYDINNLLLHTKFFRNFSKLPFQSSYICSLDEMRKLHKLAFIGLFKAAGCAEINIPALHTIMALIRHHVMLSIAEEIGVGISGIRSNSKKNYIDSRVLAEVIAEVIKYEEIPHIFAQFAVRCVIRTADKIVFTRKRVSKLRFMQSLIHELTMLCYERPYKCKLGAVKCIQFICNKMPLSWILSHLPSFLRAHLFAITELTPQICCGSIDEIKSNLRNLIVKCSKLLDRKKRSKTAKLQRKALLEVTLHLTRHITSPNSDLRCEAMELLLTIADESKISLTKILKCHKSVLMDIIPPKKHSFKFQCINTKIGIMEATTFCSSLNPPLFRLDLSVESHEMYFNELSAICKASDHSLTGLPGYLDVGSTIPLRKAAMRTLASCHYLTEQVLNIFTILYNVMGKDDAQVQYDAFECMKYFVSHRDIEMSKMHEVVRPFLTTLCDYKNTTVASTKRIEYLLQVFPTSFKYTLFEQLLVHMKSHSEALLTARTDDDLRKYLEIEEIIVTILKVFSYVTDVKLKFITILCKLIFDVECKLKLGPSSPYHEPLFIFLSKYPAETVLLFLSDENISKYEWTRFFEYMLTHVNGKIFRVSFSLPEISNRFTSLMEAACKDVNPTKQLAAIRYNTLKVTHSLIKPDDTWLFKQKKIMVCLQRIWCSENYLMGVNNLNHVYWSEPKLICRILLHYFSHNQMDVQFLFHLVSVFIYKIICNVQFLRNFLDSVVAQTYSVDWKRAVFLRYCEYYKRFNDNLKAKILQYIIIPCFDVSFKRGEGHKLVSGARSTIKYHEDLVTLFMSKVIEEINQNGCNESLKVWTQQLACLFVEHCPAFFAGPKRDQSKINLLVDFAWSSVNRGNCEDVIGKYQAHLLLSYISANLPISNSILTSVLSDLLTTNVVEIRPIVKVALDILIPAMSERITCGKDLLTEWTRRAITDNGHYMGVIVHILQTVARHYEAYYPSHYKLIPHIVNYIQRLSITSATSPENRVLAVDLIEILIKWEGKRLKDVKKLPSVTEPIQNCTTKTSQEIPKASGRRKRSVTGQLLGHQSMTQEQRLRVEKLGKYHSDVIINCLIKLTCQVAENANAVSNLTACDMLGRRCINILKVTLTSDLQPSGYYELRLSWMNRALSASNSSAPNISAICMVIEILNFLISIKNETEILDLCREIKEGIISCISSSNPRIIRYINIFLTRLMEMYPIRMDVDEEKEAFKRELLKKCRKKDGEPPYEVPIMIPEEILVIYDSLLEVIDESLYDFITSTGTSVSTLYTAIVLIKTACNSNECYVDQFFRPLVKVLMKLTNEKGDDQTTELAVPTEMYICSLDILKNRIKFMNEGCRLYFVNVVIKRIMEKTKDTKLMKTLLSIFEEWIIKYEEENFCGPNIDDLSELIRCMLAQIKERFPQLVVPLLEFTLNINNFVLEKPSIKRFKDLMIVLKDIMLFGLRCNHPPLREKFYEIFNANTDATLSDRLIPVLCTRDSSEFGEPHWIRKNFLLLLSCVDTDQKFCMNDGKGLFPTFSEILACKVTSKKTIRRLQLHKDFVLKGRNRYKNNARVIMLYRRIKLIKKHSQYLSNVQEYSVFEFLDSIERICYSNYSVLEKMWMHVFPQVFKILNDGTFSQFTKEFVALLGSKIQKMKDVPSRVLRMTFESLTRADIDYNIPTSIITNVASNQLLWHRATLLLEATIIEKRYSGINNDQVLNGLAEMYQSLRENDLLHALQTKRSSDLAKVGLDLEHLGFFNDAQYIYESVLDCKFLETRTDGNIIDKSICKEGWIRCGKELSMWEGLHAFNVASNYPNKDLMVQCLWNLDQYDVAKKILLDIQSEQPKRNVFDFKKYIYKSYLSTMELEPDQHMVTKSFLNNATASCIWNWRRAPNITSNMHKPLLQAAQQIIEIEESSNIIRELTTLNESRENFVANTNKVLRDWSNRRLMISDDLPYRGDILHWRRETNYFMSKYIENNNTGIINANVFANRRLHDCTKNILQLSKILRKENLVNVSWKILKTLENIPNILAEDGAILSKEIVKCFMTEFRHTGDVSLICSAVKTVCDLETENLESEKVSEMFALKAKLYSLLDNGEIEADEAVRMAVETDENRWKSWATYGEFLDQLYHKNIANSDLNYLQCSIFTYLNACTLCDYAVSQKFIARVIWLLSFDNEELLLMLTVHKNLTKIPPSCFLPWIPQLISLLTGQSGKYVADILIKIGLPHPQAIYLPVRTMYFTLKIEQRLPRKVEPRQTDSGFVESDTSSCSSQETGKSNQHTQQNLTLALQHCSKIIQALRFSHPTILLGLEGMADQLVWLKSSPIEENLTYLKFGLQNCNSIVFQNKGKINELGINVFDQTYIKKLALLVGVDWKNLPKIKKASSDPLLQPGVKKLMKRKFLSDFGDGSPMKLLKFMSNVRNWITLVELLTSHSFRSVLLETKSSYLSNFTLQTADIELPGEHIRQKNADYRVRISSLSPKVETVKKFGSICRRIIFRGSDGKEYPFLLVEETAATDGFRQESILQLLRSLNRELSNGKETARRFLRFNVPLFVSISPQLRLVEEGPPSVSLSDIFNETFKKNEICCYDFLSQKYYEKLSFIEATGVPVDNSTLRKVHDSIGSSYVPSTMLKEWAKRVFPAAEHYYTFRNTILNQMSLLNWAKYVFNLTDIYPDMLYIQKNTGLINVCFFKFNIQHSSEPANFWNVDTPVDFRITPNLVEFLTKMGIDGKMNSCLIAISKSCTKYDSTIDTVLRAIMRGEAIVAYNKIKFGSEMALERYVANETIVPMVNHVSCSVAFKLKNIASVLHTSNRAQDLIDNSQNVNNLSQMPPSWNPWF